MTNNKSWLNKSMKEEVNEARKGIRKQHPNSVLAAKYNLGKGSVRFYCMGLKMLMQSFNLGYYFDAEIEKLETRAKQALENQYRQRKEDISIGRNEILKNTNNDKSS